MNNFRKFGEKLKNLRGALLKKIQTLSFYLGICDSIPVGITPPAALLYIIMNLVVLVVESVDMWITFMQSLINKGNLDIFQLFTTPKNTVDKNVNNLWKSAQPKIYIYEKK